MTEILTVTPNPTIDISAHAAQVVAGPKLRCTDPQMDPGGGGVNVSRAIRILGGTTRALVATGGPTGQMLGDMLREEEIDCQIFDTGGLTRQSLSVIEDGTGKQFRFVLPGPPWPDDLVEGFAGLFGSLLRPDMLVVASGSLPPGFPPDAFAQFNRQAQSHGARLILDTSGKALNGSVKAMDRPVFLLRIDQDEAEDLAGRAFTRPEEIATYARTLIADGLAEQVVMSLGAQGTVGVSAGGGWYCQPPKVEVASATGAGDSLLGAVTLALSRGEDLATAVAWGTAAAAAAVTTPATRLCERAQVEAFHPLVRVRAI